MKDLTQQQRKAIQEQKDYGYRLFEAGQSIALCTNDHQRAGYNAALKACAYAETSAYLVKQGVAA